MQRRTERSESAFARAADVLVGGVNSPVRAFKAVGGTPPVIVRARGSAITDIDDNTYVDYVGSYGPAILGHAPQPVVTAVTKAARRGTTYGAPTVGETQLAEAVVAAMDAIEKVRFVSSGTEAVMTALRLARGATGRDKIVKCAGGYHGHADAMLAAAGSGAATLGVPSSPGVPAATAGETLVVDYNDADAVADVLDARGGDVAAVLVEPVAGNMGVVPPRDGYLAALRSACDAAGTLLIFDEVITGFRVAPGGAQKLYGVRADLTVLGKIIGGGLPVGAVGGGAALMDHLAPLGEIYQAGTLSGNPLATAAGLATLEALADDGVYERLEATAAALERGLRDAAAASGLAERVCIQRVGSMMSCFFRPPPVTNYADAAASNADAYAAFFHAMLDAGVYLAPGQFEAMFVSAAHDDGDVAQTIVAAEGAFAAAAERL
ncbi:MAG: glutamate-1-semialdehyde 2,1-aminomutase [Phycisphaerae bacterium]|nr:glutamate-1-semialdehyde 2,1-aminomutase [Phycisphaerae bacterium]